MPGIVLTVESPHEQVDLLAGGKGRNLYRLAQRGMRVPPWAVLSRGVFRAFARRAGVDKSIDDALTRLSAETAEKVSQDIERLILGVGVDADTLQAIEAAYRYAGSARIAVRSSGVDEDGDALSFAGQYSSFVNVYGLPAVVEHVKRCWASAYSVRSLRYRLTHGLPLRFVEMAVIIQQMVEAEKSGVVFTANPVSRDYQELVISSVFGLGEGLVSGAVDADTIIIDRTNGHVKGMTIGEKRECYVPATDVCGYVVRDVVDGKRDSLSLTEAEVERIRTDAETIEAIFGCPQDIEWAIADGQVLILQSRAITTIRPKKLKGTGTRIWDNANIIESYSGITAPMTFSFARDVYHHVFKEHCRIVGVPRTRLAEMDHLLQSLLGYHNGRVYYNLLNWYKVIRVSPFYKVRRKTMELSMGTEESLDDKTAESLRPFDTGSRVTSAAIRARSTLLCAWHLLRIDGLVDRFLRDFQRLHGEFEVLDYSTMSVEEVYAAFRKLRREMLGMFGRTILLEQSIVLSIGLLNILTKKWLPDAPPWVFFQMTKPDAAIESLLPGQRLAQLAAIVHQDEELSQLLQTAAATELYQALLESDRPATHAFLAQVKRYIDDFGYRSLNELKLEAPDLREDPSVLFSMLKSVVSQLETPRSAAAQDSADEYLNRHLHGWKSQLYKVVRRRVRRSLAARERVRFCRTRAFGLARRMIKAIGEALARGGMLGSGRDIFYLRLDELFGWFDGTLSQGELPALVELRKRQAAADAELEAPGRFVTQGIIWQDEYQDCGWRPQTGEEEPFDAAGASSELRGVPCSPGIAEAEAQVVTEPLEAGGKILVTYRTDPGWCAVLQSASALLIERGSPLTHVAIVARELGVPTVVQIKDLTKKIRTGMRLKVDGGSGVVHVVQRSAP